LIYRGSQALKFGSRYSKPFEQRSRSRAQSGPQDSVPAKRPLSISLRRLSASIPIRGRAHNSHRLNSVIEYSLLPPAARSSASSSFAFHDRNHTCRGSVPRPRIAKRETQSGISSNSEILTLHTSCRFGGVIPRAFISRRRAALQRGLRMRKTPLPPIFNNQTC
jgi:hypothetical protein